MARPPSFVSARGSLAVAGVLFALGIPAVGSAATITKRSLAFDPDDRPLREIRDCGLVLTHEEARAYLATRPDHADVQGTPGPPYYVAIAAHIVRQSDGTGGLPVEQYEQCIVDANLAYENMEIVFYTIGEIDYIDSDAFYFDIDSISEIDALRTTNPVADAINCYFTPNLKVGPNSPICGISAFTFSDVQAIAVNNACAATPTNHSTFPHEIGHYFDLFHTHETAFGEELVDGSNCEDAGDLLCDTEADPTLQNATVDSLTCAYTGEETDGQGDFYAPDTHQFLSYSRKHCRDRFSVEGEAQIVNTLLTLRPNLITTSVSARTSAGVVVGSAVVLAPPRPSPTSGATELDFRLEAGGVVDLAIHDVRGARVCTIVQGARFDAGSHGVRWDGSDDEGRAVAPGIYFARIATDRGGATRKIQVLR
jgi:hypothetical protein